MTSDPRRSVGSPDSAERRKIAGFILRGAIGFLVLFLFTSCTTGRWEVLGVQQETALSNAQAFLATNHTVQIRRFYAFPVCPLVNQKVVLMVQAADSAGHALSNRFEVLSGEANLSETNGLATLFSAVEGNKIIRVTVSDAGGVSTSTVTSVYFSSSAAAPFNAGAGFNSNVWAMALQPDGRILCGGYFSTVDGVASPYLARLLPSGAADAGFSTGTGPNLSVQAFCLEASGRILIGGNFTMYNGVAAPRIARLQVDGTLDTGYLTGTGFSDRIYALATQPDQKCIAGGAFKNFNGVSRNRIARLNADGTLDLSFAIGTGFDHQVGCLALQPDGRILVGGYFTAFNGSSAVYLARLNADGSLDPSFHSDFSSNLSWNVFCLAVQPDGKIWAGGNFNRYGDRPGRQLVRLRSDGQFDAGADFNYNVNALALQADGKVIVGGSFTTHGTDARNEIARLRPDGQLDGDFAPWGGFNSSTYALALQPDGRVIVGGNATLYNGVLCPGIARLNPDSSVDR